MRLYEVSVQPREGLPVTAEPFQHVGVGERGRGRSYAMLPLGRRLAESMGQESRLYAASLVRTRERGALLAVEERPGDTERAIALLRVPMGFRGWVAYYAPDPRREPCRLRGQVVRYRTTCDECGERLLAADDDSLVHPDRGDVLRWAPIEQAPGVTVLLRGVVAQGMAGRMGSGDELLVVMEPGARVVARRGGRRYGGPAVLLIEYDGATVRVRPWEEAQLASSLDEEGVPV